MRDLDRRRSVRIGGGRSDGKLRHFAPCGPFIEPLPRAQAQGKLQSMAQGLRGLGAGPFVIGGRRAAKIAWNDRNRRHRSSPSAPLCPSGYDPAAALACGARPARGHLHRGAGSRIRRPDRPLRHHHRPVGAAQSGAAGRLQPHAAAGAGLRGFAAGAQHRRTRRPCCILPAGWKTRSRFCSWRRS